MWHRMICFWCMHTYTHTYLMWTHTAEHFMLIEWCLDVSSRAWYRMDLGRIRWLPSAPRNTQGNKCSSTLLSSSLLCSLECNLRNKEKNREAKFWVRGRLTGRQAGREAGSRKDQTASNNTSVRSMSISVNKWMWRSVWVLEWKLGWGWGAFQAKCHDFQHSSSPPFIPPVLFSTLFLTWSEWHRIGRFQCSFGFEICCVAVSLYKGKIPGQVRLNKSRLDYTMSYWI